MTLREDINPIASIKEKSKATYAGFGGRSSESFVERDRRFPKDAIGVLSESTVDGGAVGFSTSLASNANVVNTRGMFAEVKDRKLDQTAIISDVAQLMPHVTNDD